MRSFLPRNKLFFYEVCDYTTMIHRLPNILTIFRIILIPLLVLGFQLPGMWCNWVTLSIFVIAGATDYFDGQRVNASASISVNFCSVIPG